MCSYKIEACSLYQSHVIGNKLIYVFDDHNMAFPVWGEFSSRNGSSYVLLTFDTHADTRPPLPAQFIQNMIIMTLLPLKNTNRKYLVSTIVI